MLIFMPRYTEPVFPVKKVVGLTADLAERIRDYRFRERIDSENEAIRQLIEAGLKAGEKIPIRNAKPSGSDGGAEPSGSSKAGKSAPRSRKASAPERQSAPAAPAKPPSKEAQLRALREQGLR